MLKRLLGRVLSFLNGLWGYALRHKIQAGVFVLAVAALGYWGYTSYQKSVTTTQYVLAGAHIAPIEQTVTGSGQVASEHQLNLSPKSSGIVASVNVKPGDTVAAGQIVASLDLTDANKAVRDAAVSLQSARISYQQSLTSNTNTAQSSSDSAFSSDTSAFTDMNTALAGINTIMQGDEISGSYSIKNVYAYSKLFNDNADVVAYRDKAIAAYNAAHAAYAAALSAYNATSRTSDPQTIANLTNTTYDALLLSAEAAKDMNDYLLNIHQRLSSANLSEPGVLTTHLSSVGTYVSTLNGDVNTVASAKNNLSSSLQTSTDSSQSLAQESAQLAYQKAQNAYQDAKDNVENYIIRAPFAGTIASVPLQRFDSAGSGTTVAVLTTTQQLATLSLNEVDAAKVKAGQKAVLTFDAIDGLTLDGTVAEVDTVGTVSQGVVSYTVKIGFDTQDPRILPGMTVNATIITASKETALVIPSSAVKTAGGESYVELANYMPSAGSGFNQGSTTREYRTGSSTEGFASSTQRRTFTGSGAGTRTGAMGPTVDASSVTTRRVNVTTGIVSDTMTEITSGLNPGDFVVSSSLNAAGKSTTQTKSIFNLFTPQRAGGNGSTRTTTSAGATRTTTGTTGARANAGFAGPGG